MGDVVEFPSLKADDISAADMLRAIADDEPNKAFVLIWPKDGGKSIYYSNTSDAPTVLMRVNEFVYKFYNGDFE